MCMSHTTVRDPVHAASKGQHCSQNPKSTPNLPADGGYGPGCSCTEAGASQGWAPFPQVQKHFGVNPYTWGYSLGFGGSTTPLFWHSAWGRAAAFLFT